MWKVCIQLFYVFVRLSASSLKAMPEIWKKLVKQSRLSSQINRELKVPTRVGPMFSCSSVQEWNSAEANKHQGLLVERSIDPLRWQYVAEDLYSKKSTNGDSLFHKVLDMQSPTLQSTIRKTAVEASRGLPKELAKLVSADCEAFAKVAHEMVPEAKELLIKLELFGDNVCGRWHQDHYVLRNICSYNLSGTEYTANSNVDFYELEYCGNNDCIIRDKSKIMSANVGDLVMIKGKKFPHKVKGLVHRSPDVKYDENSMVQNRILLKVDILDLE